MNGSKKPTIKDVSRVAGVSIATVSRYLNASGYVDDSTKRAIQAAVEATHYRINKNAQMLKTKRSCQIMLAVPDIGNPYYAEMFKTLQAALAGHGYTLLLVDTGADPAQERGAIQRMEEIGCDGLIFCSIENDAAVAQALAALQKPVVVGQSYDTLQFDTIHSLGGRGVYLAAAHLLSLGHRRVAYAGGPEGSAVNRRRREGYLSALAEAGVAPHRDWIFEMDFTMDAGYKAGVYLSTLTERPTAICAANDVIAMGILQALGERGLRVPEDISLTGEDNIAFARVSRPGLTTVDNSGGAFAAHAAALLLSRLSGAYAGPPRDVLCPRELILRESTRALRPEEV